MVESLAQQVRDMRDHGVPVDPRVVQAMQVMATYHSMADDRDLKRMHNAMRMYRARHGKNPEPVITTTSAPLLSSSPTVGVSSSQDFPIQSSVPTQYQD